MAASREDTFNVMVLASLISLIVILVSLSALYAFTHDNYLDSYFLLEVLFNAQNTAASEALATYAFGQGPMQFIPIIFIVIVDNMSRILIVSFIIAAVIDYLNYANVEGVVNLVKANGLHDHVILCSYTGITERLIKELNAQGTRHIVIEPDETREAELYEKKILALFDDYTNETVLKLARIDRAKAIVFTSTSNADNVVGTLIARRLNPSIKVLSRLGDEGVRKKVYGIGADMAVIPEHLAGIEMGEYIVRAGGA